MQMDHVERVREATESFALAPASEPLLTNPTEVSKATAELKVDKSPCLNGVPYRAVRIFPRKAVTFLTKVFNAVLKWQHYPAALKHARVISRLEPGNDSTLPSSQKDPSVYWTQWGSSLKRSCVPGSWNRSTLEACSGTSSFGFDPGSARPCS